MYRSRHYFRVVRRNTNAYSTIANTFDRSRKNPSSSSNLFKNAKKRGPLPEPPSSQHSALKEDNVDVSPACPTEQPEEEPRSTHPLLLADHHQAGEWTPSPAKGVDLLPYKRLLLNRPSADPVLNMTDSIEEVTSISDDIDWIEMSFAPGTFVETRKYAVCILNSFQGFLTSTSWIQERISLSRGRFSGDN